MHIPLPKPLRQLGLPKEDIEAVLGAQLDLVDRLVNRVLRFLAHAPGTVEVAVGQFVELGDIDFTSHLARDANTR